VLAAKVGAAMVLSVATMVLALIIAGVVTAIAGSGLDGAWSLPLGMVGQALFYLAAAILVGVGFGAAFLASAPAIVLYLVLPPAWSVVASIPALEGAAGWLDGSRSLELMTEQLLDASEWARVATTLALWMGLPFVIGIWRIAKGEIR
jgi:ABC-2 type transport system permease protein